MGGETVSNRVTVARSILQDLLETKHRLGLVEVWVIENEQVLKDKGLLKEINAILYGSDRKEG